MPSFRRIAALAVLSILASCAPLSGPAAPATPGMPTSSPSVASTAGPTRPPAVYTLRVQLSTDADWSTLNVLNTVPLQHARLVDQGGNLTNVSYDGADLSVAQTLADAELLQQVSITVDYQVPADAVGTSVPYLLQKGANNTTTVRFYKVERDVAYLLQDVTRQGNVPGHEQTNPYAFSFDLKTLLQETSSLPTAAAPEPTQSLVAREVISPANANQLTPIGSIPVATALGGMAVSPDGKLLAISNLEGTGLWDLSSRHLLNTLVQDGPPSSAAFSPDGTRLAIGLGGGGTPEEARVDLWDVSSGRLLARIVGTGQRVVGPVSGLAFSPNNRLLAFAQGFRTFIWDTKSESQLFVLSHRGGGEGLQEIAISPDGGLLAVAVQAGMIRIWDIHRWKLIRTLVIFDDSFTHGVAFSTDGRMFAATGSNNHKLVIWTVADWKRVQTLTVDTPSEVTFSPDGGLVAVSQPGHGVTLFDTATGQLAHHDDAYSAPFAFSPDGKMLIVSQYSSFSTFFLGVP